MFVLYPDFDPPPGWRSRAEGGLVQLTPPDVEAALMLVFPVASGMTPVKWVEDFLASEQRGGFVLLSATREELVSDGGLRGVAYDVTGGLRVPDALVERRAYVVFADGKAVYPFALHASVATHDAVAAAFFAAARSARRPAAAPG